MAKKEMVLNLTTENTAVTEREILNVFSVFPVASVVKDPNYNVLPDSSAQSVGRHDILNIFQHLGLRSQKLKCPASFTHQISINSA